MVKKTIPKTILGLLFAIMLISFPLTGDNRGNDWKIIALNLADYRIYLEDHTPLDRLFIINNTGFFLVDQKSVIQIKQKGIPFQVRHPLFPLGQKTKKNNIGEYHTYQETVWLLNDLVSRFPDQAQVFSIGQSLEGRELLVVKISDNVISNEEEPNIFISGCHHAREWISVEMPLLFARYLLENYANNQQVQTAVDGAQIYIMPIQNPDGFEFSIHTYRMWRKNRRYNGDLEWGVDTNRNYGYMWGFDDQGSSPLPADAVYRGPYPFSEPENLAVRDFLLSNPPSGALNFHNYSQMILYPWGYVDLPAPDDAEMKEIARKMSELIYEVNGRVYTYGAGATTIYPTNGDADDWIYGIFGAFSYTIELPPELFIQGGFFTSEEMIDSAFREVLPAMLYFVKYFIEKTNRETKKIK